MLKTDKTNAEILSEEMMDFAKLVMKYSPRSFVRMITAVDIDHLRYQMITNGATKEELRTVAECFHDLNELLDTLTV